MKRKKILVIDKCYECKFVSYLFVKYQPGCDFYNDPSRIKKITTKSIPKWCPLEDAKEE